MLSNILSPRSPSNKPDKSNLKNIYQKFQSLLGRGKESPKSDIVKEGMLSSRSTAVSEDSYITPVSSVDDLMALSPKTSKDYECDRTNTTSDFLTGADFDSICELTMHEVPSENMFIDPNSLDYLVKCADSKRNGNIIDRGKESLFVKFDPLYSKTALTEVVKTPSTEICECDGGYETGSGISGLTDEISTPKLSLSAESPLSITNKDKPMQVVPPTVNEIYKPVRTKSTPTLMRSVSAILTPIRVATENLISIAGETPPQGHTSPRDQQYNIHEGDRLQSLRIILQKHNQEMLHLTQENRELKSALQDAEHHHLRQIKELNDKIKKLSDENAYFTEKESKLIQQVNEKVLNNKQMCIVMEEYEKTISSLIGELQRQKIQSLELQQKLTAERDDALTHLSNMESSFNDLHSKYEKCKGIIYETKAREKSFENKICEYEDSIKKYEDLYNNLKEATSDKLAKANDTLASIQKNHSMEIAKLNALIKRHEITISSLQDTLNQKTREVEELTTICDQLMNA